jgi:DNA polymerase III sliding clamp (beta) subunit (PCNA family)
MIKIKTNTLQKLLTKVLKAVSNNKLLPITSLVGIKTSKEGVLTLVAYDGGNFLKVSTSIDFHEDKYVAINADSFYALVSRLTSDDITLDFTQDYLKVNSSGSNYKFDIAYEEGSVVKFPEFEVDINNPTASIQLADLELALTLNKPAAATTSELISITGAYFGDKIVTTNGYMACITNKKLFNNPLLLTYNTLNLTSALSGEKVKVGVGTKIWFMDDNGTLIVGDPMPQVNDYPLVKVLEFLETDSVGTFKIAKKDVIQSLDRLTIFVLDFDNNVIEAEITETQLMLKSLKNSAVEVIKLTGPHTPFKFKIDYGYLKTQIASLKDEVVEVKYGSQSSISLVEKEATHVVALISE